MLAWVQQTLADGWDPNTRAGNVDSIMNTRHNLTMSYLGGFGGFRIMQNARNNYFEVCVYCHTPHGANRQVSAPLWNRSRTSIVYSLYANPRTYDQPVTQPGPNSLTCLSCHDGGVSVDSIINMPNRPAGAYAGYAPQHETALGDSNKDFLDQWDLPVGGGSTGHMHIKNNLGSGRELSCRICHSGMTAPEFYGFQIAENLSDLRNDHPIGVTYPTINRQPNPNYPPFERVAVLQDYNPPRGVAADSFGRTYYYFDTNSSGKLDKNEVRLYNSGQGAEVECGSCHDPHGVPSAGPGSEFIPSFLRVSNSGSRLCLTCHSMQEDITQ